MTRHHMVNPPALPPPSGFSHGATAAEGRTLYIAGQTGHQLDLEISTDLVEQFAQACRSVARVIAEAGGKPEDVVSMSIYTTEIGGYRESLAAIGSAYREVFGKHYPPMALFGVSELFDPRAMVELVCVAVIPDA